MDFNRHTDVNLEGKRIVLFTDFSSEFSVSRHEEVTTGLRASGIQLFVIGPKFSEDDAEEVDNEPSFEMKDGSSVEIKDEPGFSVKPEPSSGGSDNTKPSKKQILNWNGKSKTTVQQAGETLAEEMVSKTDGVLCTFKDALSQLLYFEQKDKGSAYWNTTLDIGPDFKIPISGRIKVQQSTLPTWKKEYKDDPSQHIRDEVSYHLGDEMQTEVPQEEIIEGYLFGTTLVPCSDEDVSRMYCSNSPRSLSVVGFTEASRVPHNLRIGNQVVAVTAPDGNEPAAEALSALIHALAELDMVAIARRVYSKNFDPQIGALFPEINEDYECLLWTQLPYSQNIQSPVFPSLQKKIEKLKKVEKDAMDSLINAMTL